MVNKKKLAAAAMTSAMILSAMAGCSKKDDTTPTTTVKQNTAETTTQKQEEPVKEVKNVLDFEDGSLSFVKVDTGNLTCDGGNLSVAFFNGSKALKMEAVKTDAGMTTGIGIDLNAVLGDNVEKVAKITYEIAVESPETKFHAVAGSTTAKFGTPASNWVVYSASKNPVTVTVGPNAPYSKSDSNVLVITKNSGNGNNCDTAYSATGKYSNFYVDNIAFFDQAGNPVEIASTTAAYAATGFGERDWSNLVEIDAATEQVIPGLAAANKGGWNQAPDWVMNFYEKEVEVEEKDADGNTILDAEGNPKTKTEVQKFGSADLTGLFKEGAIITIYFSADKDVYATSGQSTPIWLVASNNEGDKTWGWDRCGSHVAGCSEDTYVKVNDGFNMAQLSVEKFIECLKQQSGLESIDLTGAWGLQCEGCIDWSVSAVTVGMPK